MATDDLKKELLIVKAGRPRYFGFLKAGATRLHGFVVTAKRIAGPVIVDLQRNSGNPGQPLRGTVRYDDRAKRLLFEMDGPPPGWLNVALQQAAIEQSISLGNYEVAAYPEGQPLPVVDGGGEPLEPPPIRPPAPTLPPPSEEMAALAQTCKERMARIAPAVKRVVAAQGAGATRVQALSVALAEAIGRKDYRGVLVLVDILEPLVQESPVAPSPPPAPDPRENQLLDQSRAAWETARRRAEEDVERLKAAILDAYRDEDEYAQVVAGVRRLDAVLGPLDEQFALRLQAARNAAPTERPQRRQEARAVLQHYLNYLTTNGLVQAIDANPFLPLTVHQGLLTVLRDLDKKLA